MPSLDVVKELRISDLGLRIGNWIAIRNPKSTIRNRNESTRCLILK
jgi:hypothetical protein